MVLLALTLTAIKQRSTNVGREELQGGARVLIEHEEEREREIWRTNLLLCGEAYGGRKRGEEEGRGIRQVGP